MMDLTIFGGDSSSEDDESELRDELDEDTALLLRFRTRFLVVGFAALAGGMGSCVFGGKICGGE